LFWSTLRVGTAGPPDEEIVLKWLPKAAAASVRNAIITRQLLEPVCAAHQSLLTLASQDRYLGRRIWEQTANAFGHLRQRIPQDWRSLKLNAEQMKMLSQVHQWLHQPEQLRSERNRRYVQRELQRQQQWFDQVQRYPLTPSQRSSIVCDEDNNLVVAGAGTGKTSTIVGKVGYLLRKGHLQPGEILLLAFARKAKEEMQQRVREKFGLELEVRTFHSLGLEILAQVEGKRPSLSPLAENEQGLAQAIDRYLQQLSSNPDRRQVVSRFLTLFRYPRVPETAFASAHQYYQYLKSQDITTLRGERVKSFGELTIADFLTCNGIAYQYEAAYEHPTATMYHRQYKPDFYLPEHGIYIEYFGVDRQGNTARHINRQQYAESMHWKRQTHQQMGTTMVELFAYELWENSLCSVLAERLEQRGVKLTPIDPSQLYALASQSGEASRVAQLLCAFLNLFKSNHWTLAEVRQRIASMADRERAGSFFELFALVLEHYQAELGAAGEIDFHDMILRASEYVAQRRYRSAFRYVLVDEFQDISRGRARLLTEMLKQHQDRTLSCVGDDWQSIYRFTGSDVGIMTRFEQYFGHTLRTDLEQTFRFNRELLEASSRFVQKNPAQLRKQLLSPINLGAAAIRIVYEAADAPEGSGMHQALSEICAAQDGQPPSVMLLGRYHFSLPPNLTALRQQYPMLRIEARTVHTAKGLETDYVVLLNANRGRYGFPSEISDDPLLGLVLAQAEAFPNAEERRLFYVALTRARKRAFLVVDETCPSSFVRELESSEYAAWVSTTGAAQRLACPKCDGGSLVLRRGDFGIFWGCSNYPFCDGKANVCQKCGQGVFLRHGQEYACSNEDCDARAEACPRCNDGILKLRDSRYGPFLGCSNWSPQGLSCNYTRDLRRRRN
jgi:DNA helicase-4